MVSRRKQTAQFSHHTHARVRSSKPQQFNKPIAFAAALRQDRRYYKANRFRLIVSPRTSAILYWWCWCTAPVAFEARAGGRQRQLPLASIVIDSRSCAGRRQQHPFLDVRTKLRSQDVSSAIRLRECALRFTYPIP